MLRALKTGVRRRYGREPETRRRQPAKAKLPACSAPPRLRGEVLSRIETRILARARGQAAFSPEHRRRESRIVK